MALAERIRQRRDELRLTQVQLAEMTGLHQTMISKIERGEESRTGTLAKVAAALGLEITLAPAASQSAPAA